MISSPIASRAFLTPRGASLDKTLVLAHNTKRTRIAVETQAVAREVSQCASGATVQVVLQGEWPTGPGFHVTDAEIFRHIRLMSMQVASE
jgi:hypothetical protein